ncbi:MAG: hypothetical protein ACOC1V_07790 [Candidatus Saliniplasma sp.]
MNEGHLLRRIIHSLSWIVLVYYLLPEYIAGYNKRSLLIILVVSILAFEGLRLHEEWHIFGMRDYEKKQIAAYAWAAMAAGIALVLFPMHLNILCFIGMGIVDPLIGELKYHAPQFYPYVPLVSWGIIGIVVLYLFTPYTFAIIFAFSVLGAFTAVSAEYPSIIIDDDFLMVIVPLVVLYAIELILL